MYSRICKGDSYKIKVLIKDDQGNPRDLSLIQSVGYKLAKSVRSIPLIEKDLNSSYISVEPLEGIINIVLSEVDTTSLPSGTIYHEVEVKEALAGVYTPLKETLTIVEKLI